MSETRKRNNQGPYFAGDGRMGHGSSIAIVAEQNFSMAYGLLDSSRSSAGRAIGMVDVSTERAKVPLAPRYSYEELRPLGSRLRGPRQTRFRHRLALFQAAQGDESLALAVLNNHPDLGYGLELARILAGRDGDPATGIMHEIAQVDPGFYKSGELDSVAELARQLNVDIRPQLERLGSNGVRSPNGLVGARLDFASAYAKAGYPEEALSIYNLAYNTPGHLSLKAMAGSVIAVEFARNGANAQSLVEEVDGDTIRCKRDQAYLVPERRTSLVYSNLALSNGLVGKRPYPHLAQAITDAQFLAETSDYQKEAARAYLRIAEVQAEFNGDPRLAISEALSIVDEEPGLAQLVGLANPRLRQELAEDAFRFLLRVKNYPVARDLLFGMTMNPFLIRQRDFFGPAVLFAKMASAQLGVPV